MMKEVLVVTGNLMTTKDFTPRRAESAATGGAALPHGVSIRGYGSAGEIGGPDQNRTDDLLIANETLYQLSYGPTRGRSARG